MYFCISIGAMRVKSILVMQLLIFTERDGTYEGNYCHNRRGGDFLCGRGL